MGAVGSKASGTIGSTGRSPPSGDRSAGSDGGSVKWSFYAGQAVYGSPAVDSNGRIYIGSADGTLWALNPVQTNAVTYIVQRMTSISALFYIATLAFYIQGRLASALKPRGLFYAFSAGTALCALFSKENSFMLPVAILLVEWLFISPNIFMKILKRMKWYHWVGIFLIATAFFPLFEHRLMGILKGFNNRSFTLNERLLTEARVVVHYISLLILPWPGRMNFN